MIYDGNEDLSGHQKGSMTTYFLIADWSTHISVYQRDHWHCHCHTARISTNNTNYSSRHLQYGYGTVVYGHWSLVIDIDVEC